MRLPRLRFTVRSLMCLVLILGIALHFGLAALRVHSAKEVHAHIWFSIQEGIPNMTMNMAIRPPFWPRYWRCLEGLPWKSQPLCPQVEGRLHDFCSFAHPEIVYTDGAGRIGVRTTKEQDDILNERNLIRLNERKLSRSGQADNQRDVHRPN